MSIDGKTTFLLDLNQKRESLIKWNSECFEFITGYCYGLTEVMKKTVRKLEILN